MTDMTRSKTVSLIHSDRRWFPDLVELWRGRHLVGAFVMRNLRLRFAQTILGPVWLLLQAGVTTVVFSMFFGNLLNVPSDGLPYPIFVVTGMLLWNLFQRGAAEVSTSVVMHAQLIGKVYFPRLTVPLSALVTAAIDQIPLLLILIVLCIAYGTPIAATVVYVPLIVLMILCLSLGVGLFATSADTIYRDARIVLPHALQLVFYLTPVVFPLSLLSGRWHTLLMLNPLTGLVESFRALTFGLDTPVGPLAVIASGIVSVAVLVLGLVVFVRTEPLFVDRS